jgi:hypothetical protein
MVEGVVPLNRVHEGGGESFSDSAVKAVEVAGVWVNDATRDCVIFWNCHRSSDHFQVERLTHLEYLESLREHKFRIHGGIGDGGAEQPIRFEGIVAFIFVGEVF